MKTLLIIFQVALIFRSTQGSCSECKTVLEGPLNGTYYYNGSNPDCADGCHYRRENTGKVYCFQTQGTYTTSSCDVTFVTSWFMDGCSCEVKTALELPNNPNGCIISRAAPSNKACQCTLDSTVPWCKARVVACLDPLSSFCINPDKGPESCRQGGGDCHGY